MLKRLFLPVTRGQRQTAPSHAAVTKAEETLPARFQDSNRHDSGHVTRPDGKSDVAYRALSTVPEGSVLCPLPSSGGAGPREPVWPGSKALGG